MEEVVLYKNVNFIFEKYTMSWNSLDKMSAKKEFNDEVLNEVDKIYDYVSKYPVNWKIDIFDNVLKSLEKDIRTNFPYLDDKSVKRLINYFSYEWK